MKILNENKVFINEFDDHSEKITFLLKTFNYRISLFIYCI